MSINSSNGKSETLSARAHEAVVPQNEASYKTTKYDRGKFYFPGVECEKVPVLFDKNSFIDTLNMARLMTRSFTGIVPKVLDEVQALVGAGLACYPRITLNTDSVKLVCKHSMYRGLFQHTIRRARSRRRGVLKPLMTYDSSCDLYKAASNLNKAEVEELGLIKNQYNIWFSEYVRYLFDFKDRFSFKPEVFGLGAPTVEVSHVVPGAIEALAAKLSTDGLDVNFPQLSNIDLTGVLPKTLCDVLEGVKSLDSWIKLIFYQVFRIMMLCYIKRRHGDSAFVSIVEVALSSYALTKLGLSEAMALTSNVAVTGLVHTFFSTCEEESFVAEAFDSTLLSSFSTLFGAVYTYQSYCDLKFDQVWSKVMVSAKNTMSGSKNLIDAFLSVTHYFIESIFEYFAELPQILQQWQQVELEINALVNSGMPMTLHNTKVVVRYYESLQRYAETDTPYAQKAKSILEKIRARVKNINQIIRQGETIRMLPTIAVLAGAPGVGKSSLVQPFCVAIIQSLRRKEYIEPYFADYLMHNLRDEYVVWNNSENFQDNYRGQFFCVEDDFAQYKDPHKSTAAGLVNHMSTAPATVEKSAVEDKKNSFFKSQFIIKTTNALGFNDPFMVNTAARDRRLDQNTVIVHVREPFRKIAEGVNPADFNVLTWATTTHYSIDQEAVARDKRDHGFNSRDHLMDHLDRLYEFYEYSYTNKSVGRIMTFRELVDKTTDLFHENYRAYLRDQNYLNMLIYDTVEDRDMRPMVLERYLDLMEIPYGEGEDGDSLFKRLKDFVASSTETVLNNSGKCLAVLTGALTAVALFRTFYNTTMHDEIFSESAETRFVKVKSKFRRKSLKPPSLQTVGVNLASEAANSEVLDLVRGSTYLLTLVKDKHSRANPTTVCCVLFFDERDLIIPTHCVKRMYDYLDENGPFAVEMRNIKNNDVRYCDHNKILIGPDFESCSNIVTLDQGTETHISDACVLRVSASIGLKGRNLKKHFVTEDQVTSLVGASIRTCLLSFTVDRRGVSSVMSEVASEVRNIPQPYEDLVVMRGVFSDYATFAGACGSPYVISNSYGIRTDSHNKILSCHSAGSKNACSLSFVVTKELLEQAQEFFNELKAESAMSRDYTTSVKNLIDEIYFQPSLGAGELIKHDMVGSRGSEFYNPHSLTPSFNNKTVLFKTDYAGEICEFLYEKGAVVKPVCSSSDKTPYVVPALKGVGPSSIAEAINAYGVDWQEVFFNAQIVGHIKNFMYDKFVSGSKNIGTTKVKMDFERAILGFGDYLKPINRSSSNGFGIYDKRELFGAAGDFNMDGPLVDELRKDLEVAKDNLKEGKEIPLVYSDFPKDEALPTDKVHFDRKVRIVSGSPLMGTILYREAFGSFVIMVNANVLNNHLIGVNMLDSTQVTSIVSGISLYKNAFAGDYSKFDKRFLPQFVKLFGDMANMYYDDHGTDNYNIRRTLLAMLMRSVHVCKDGFEHAFFRWEGGNPSGNPLTTVLNTVGNLFLMYYSTVVCYYTRTLDLQEENLKLRYDDVSDVLQSMVIYCNGDDMIMSVSDDIASVFSPQDLCAFVCGKGMTLTNDTKAGDVGGWIDPFMVTILKRSFKFVEGKWVACLAIESIFKRLLFQRKNDPNIEKEIIKSAAYELSLHGRELFSTFIGKVKAAWGKMVKRYPSYRFESAGCFEFETAFDEYVDSVIAYEW